MTRFSGRTAPPHPGGAPGVADAVMREAYSHEVSSAGFWPGGGGIDHAAFYSYAYPTPEGFGASPVRPEAASFNETLGEFLLPYDAVRSAPDPDAALSVVSREHLRGGGRDRRVGSCRPRMRARAPRRSPAVP